jgi:lipase maturation factor 1
MLERNPSFVFRWLFDSSYGASQALIPRWIFLRALAAIYFSAFYSLLFQIKGLIGPQGVLPAREYLAAVGRAFPLSKYWYAPSLFWISSSSQMLMVVTWIGLAASVIALLNFWPRLMFLICFVCFLTFVSSSGEFSSYQSDGMLLEAGFISLFFAPPGLQPGWGADHPPSRASLFLLQWEWFRIYFESGMVKLVSGDQQWRRLSAMDEYYQNGPLPTWIGWHVQHLPHWFHAASAAGTFLLELVLVFMLFFPRRVRIICFLIVTPWEIGVILTANYTFLNYLVLALGFLLLDDKALLRFVPQRQRWRTFEPSIAGGQAKQDRVRTSGETSHQILVDDAVGQRLNVGLRTLGLAASAVMLSWIFYNSTAEMIGIPLRRIPLPTAPIAALEPFRISNQYGLFAVMTNGRYEIEFQGSEDGNNWIAYSFRYKPQALNEAPRIYAPYQPRFDWNLWFASLSDWRSNELVTLAEERLLESEPDVVALFKSNPFPAKRPRFVRAVLWRYWFTSTDEKRRTGNWWRRQYLGLYAPEVSLSADDRVVVVQWPDELPLHN